MNLTPVFHTRQPWYDSRTLIVHYSSENVSVFIENRSNQQTRERLILKLEPIFILNQQTKIDEINLFEKTFGEYERMESIAIDQVIFYTLNTKNKPQLVGIAMAEDAILNYYHLHLKQSYILTKYMYLFDTHKPAYTAVMTLNQKSYYKELSIDYKNIVNNVPSQTREGHLYSFSVKQFVASVASQTDAYPFSTIELKVLFIYGSDYKRETHLSYIPKWIRIVASLLMLFIIVAAITLCIIRRKLRLPLHDFLSAFIDCLIPFIGGGNIQMRHRFERWFFGILYFGAFFIVSVFVGNLLDSIVQVHTRKVSTFDELTQINAPIFIDPDLKLHSELIQEILRRKMGSNINYNGFVSIYERRKNRKSFVLIIRKFYSYLARFYNTYDIDFDEIVEPLGEIPNRYVFQSNYYVSERLRKTVDKVTNSMMESGLYQFYHSHISFKHQWMLTFLSKPKSHGNADDRGDDLMALTKPQFTRPMILFCCLMGFTLIVFIAELVIFGWLGWRNRRVMPIVPLYHTTNRYRKSRNGARRPMIRSHSTPSIIDGWTPFNGIQNRKLRRHSVS